MCYAMVLRAQAQATRRSGTEARPSRFTARPLFCVRCRTPHAPVPHHTPPATLARLVVVNPSSLVKCAKALNCVY